MPHGKPRRLSELRSTEPTSHDLNKASPHALARGIYGCTVVIREILVECRLENRELHDVVATLNRIVTLAAALQQKADNK